MIEHPLFEEHPIQTIRAISLVTGISRTTILKACQFGPLKDCSYKSAETWLIDTSSKLFKQWLSAHPTQRRVKGRLAREQRSQDGGKQAQATHTSLGGFQETQNRTKMGDILAVQLFDGSEALVRVIGPSATIGGESKDFVRVDVLQSTGPYVELWYITAMGDRSTPYEYTLPAVSDPMHGYDWITKPLNTYRILSWEELQPLTIVPLYRELDAARGAEYAKYDYESDRGYVIAAKIFLRDAGYRITSALKERKPFQYSRDIDMERFHVCSPEDRFGSAKVWTCQEVVAEAQRLREKSHISEKLALSA